VKRRFIITEKNKTCQPFFSASSGAEILFFEDFGLEPQPAKAILVTHLCYVGRCEKREMKVCIGVVMRLWLMEFGGPLSVLTPAAGTF